MKPKISDYVLIKFLETHIVYEIDMLQTAYEQNNIAVERILDKGEEPERFSRNTILECYVSHSRNLISFYIDRLKADGTKTRPDDALAIDYFDDETNWYQIIDEFKDENINYLKKFRNRSGKEILHLTYGRKDENDPTRLWDFKTYNILMALTEVFFHYLNPKFMTTGMQSFAHYIEQRIKKDNEIVKRINEKQKNQNNLN